MKLERYLAAKAYKYVPFKTGIESIDATGAFGNDDFILLAGGTGSGKTYLSMFMALSAAKAGMKVLFVSFEVFAHEFVKRMGLMGFDFENDFGELDENRRNRFMAAHCEDLKYPPTFDVIDGWVDALRPDLLFVDSFGCLVSDKSNTAQLSMDYATEYSFYPRKYKCTVIVTEQFVKSYDGCRRPTENIVANGKGLCDKATKICLLYKYLRYNKDKAATCHNDMIRHVVEMDVMKDRTARVKQLGAHYLLEWRGFRNLYPDEEETYTDYVFKKGKE